MCFQMGSEKWQCLDHPNRVGQLIPQSCHCSTGKLGFDPDIWNNKLKLSGYVEEAYLTTVPKVPKNPVAVFSKMAE